MRRMKIKVTWTQIVEYEVDKDEYDSHLTSEEIASHDEMLAQDDPASFFKQCKPMHSWSTVTASEISSW